MFDPYIVYISMYFFICKKFQLHKNGPTFMNICSITDIYNVITDDLSFD